MFHTLCINYMYKCTDNQHKDFNFIMYFHYNIFNNMFRPVIQPFSGWYFVYMILL